MECASDDSARESSTSEDEDPETILRLPNGLKFRLVFCRGGIEVAIYNSGKGGRWTSFWTLTSYLTPVMVAL